MKGLLLLLTTITTLTSFSQGLEIINKADIKNLPEGKKFAFIEPATDTNQIQFVATILAKDKNRKTIIESLYFEIRKQANKLGANCYKIRTFARDTLKHETVLILDCYFAWDATLAVNADNHEKNTVFIFGKEKEDDGRTISFNINDGVKEIKAGTYFKYILKEGEELKISKGGLTGETMWLKWEKNKQLAFYTLTGFGLMDLQHQPDYGIAFNTGRINRINDISLGLLLTHLLKQNN